MQAIAWDQHDERLAVLCQGKYGHIPYASKWCTLCDSMAFKVQIFVGRTVDW